LTSSVVITGSTGFIGSALCKKLKERKEYSIVKVTRSKKHKSDYCQVSNYKNSPSGDILIHLGENSDRAIVNKLGDSYVDNSIDVIESLLEKKYEKIIYSSSSVVYGFKGNNPYGENKKIHGHDIYSKAKLENEKRVLLSGGVVVRFSNVIGNGMSKNNVLSDILKQFPGNGPLNINNLKPIQDFIFLDDAVEALLCLIEKDLSGVFNIGSGVATSINSLINEVLNLKNQKDREIISALINSNYSYNALNIQHIKNVTGWHPKHTLTQSIKKIINNHE
jgi:nucleoside-diphosphate-sugar epimerase